MHSIGTDLAPAPNSMSHPVDTCSPPLPDSHPALGTSMPREAGLDAATLFPAG